MKCKTTIIILSAALALSCIGNIYLGVTLHKAGNQAASMVDLSEKIASLETAVAAKDAELHSLTSQISKLQLTVDAYENQKEKYWTLAVADYTITLREGTQEDTLDLIQCRDNREKLLLTFQKEYDYIVPEDISAEAFEECLGHSGFRLYRKHPLGTQVHYYEVDYYAVEDELEHLAYRWGAKDDDVYETDVDGDGIDELICNVMWLADGAMDVLIYHFDGDKVLKGYGSDLLDQPVDNHGLGAIMTQYLPDVKKVHISYWQDAADGYLEKDYDIDLSKLEL